MKYAYLCVLVLAQTATVVAYGSEACESLYSKTTYALSHTKKALNATNFEHQVYYAERALIMMEDAQSMITECSCTDSEEKNYQAIRNLTQAVEPNDWDAGRFYSKKALAEIQELITVLDVCSNATYEQKQNAKEISTVNDSKQGQDSNLKDLDEDIQNLGQSLEELIKKLQTLPDGEDQNNLVHRRLITDKTKQLLEKALDQLEDD